MAGDPSLLDRINALRAEMSAPTSPEREAKPAPLDTPEQAALRQVLEAAAYAVTVPPPGARESRRRAYREFLAAMGAAAELLP